MCHELAPWVFFRANAVKIEFFRGKEFALAFPATSHGRDLDLVTENCESRFLHA